LVKILIFFFFFKRKIIKLFGNTRGKEREREKCLAKLTTILFTVGG
jgi:hypothetical protein